MATEDLVPEPEVEAASSIDDSQPSGAGPVLAPSDAGMGIASEVSTPAPDSQAACSTSSRPVTPDEPLVDVTATVAEESGTGEEPANDVSAPALPPAEVKPTVSENTFEHTTDDQDDAVVIDHADAKGDAKPLSTACGSSGEHASPTASASS